MSSKALQHNGMACMGKRKQAVCRQREIVMEEFTKSTKPENTGLLVRKNYGCVLGWVTFWAGKNMVLSNDQLQLSKELVLGQAPD